MPGRILQLSPAQSQTLSGYLTRGDYPGAYRYLQQVTRQAAASEQNASIRNELNAVSNWLGIAAQINANDGSFYSDLVRGATIWQGNAAGIAADEAWFQAGSDALAESVINAVLNGGVPDLGYILNEDVQTAVNLMGLERDAWAGTLADGLPRWLLGLGRDQVQIEGATAAEYLGDLLKALLSQASGTARAAGVDAQIYGVLSWMMENGLGELISDVLASIDPDGIQDAINDAWDAIRNWMPRRDPLALDLDGDGLETSSADGSILFDHDGDGVRGGTGWIRPDDGLLVLDRNGNGAIDSGQELFGADTIMSNGERASSGFEALRDLDSNGDGVFEANDEQFANVRVWRDLNQDGVSQVNELFTLEELGISAINLTPTSTADVNLGNGNVIDNSGTYVRADGSTALVGDMLFAMNNFYRDFSGSLDPVEVSEEASALPGVRGSGAVRDLAEAASLSGALLAAMQALGPDMSRGEMLARVREIVLLWADTSAMETSEHELETDGRTVYFHGAIPASVASQGPEAVQAWREQQHAYWAPIIAVLERFNGSTLFSISGDAVSTGGRTYQWQTLADGSQMLYVELAQAQLDLIVRAYETLVDSVYGGLVLRTRLSVYLDQVALAVDESGSLAWDLSGLRSLFESRRQQDPTQALIDMMDFHRYGLEFASLIGWNVFGDMHPWLDELRATEQGRDVLAAAGLNLSQGQGSEANDLIEGGVSDDVISAGGGSDIVFGDAGNDTLRGRDGNDVLDGGEGNDALYGENDHDTLVGGLGNDYMEGGSGDDTYIIRLGDGSDTISEYYGNDRVVFEGIDSSQVMAVERYGDNLVIVFGEGQRLTINSYFQYAYRQVESFEFTDGAWGMQEILDRLVRPGTSNADVITGDGLVDRMMGFAGNDTLRGRDGNDVLDGGEGNDALYGENDHDTLVGGLGNDYMEGGSGDDTYIIRLGDGSDTISEYYGNDRVVFEGIDSSQVMAVERYGDNLVIVFGEGQRLTINSYFQYAYRQVESFEFTDGAWGMQEILDRLVRPGTSNADVITGDGLVDRMMGFAGNDTLRGRDGNDVLDGGEGNDALYGENDHDTLVGGLGNDYMEGGSGDDTYIIRLGDGSDTISEYYGNDRVVFEGIDSSQVTAVERSGNDLVIRLGAEQSVTISAYFQYEYRQVEAFEFADGVVWAFDEIVSLVSTPGTSGNDSITADALANWILGLGGHDTLRGRDGNDVLDGGEGNDALYGENDHDTLVGGLGNDYMEGGSGDDTYIIRLGDGSDTISEYYGNDRVVFEGIDSSQVTAVERYGDNLVIVFGEGQRLTINSYFQYAYRQVESFEFTDGAWGMQEILDRLVRPGTSNADVITGDGLVDRMMGFAGNDTLRGRDGNDVLDGGEGNDALYGENDHDTLVGGLGNDYMEGGSGDDTYIIRLGDGSDTISEYYGNDRVVFEGIDSSQVMAVERYGDNLVIVFGEGQRLTINSYFQYAYRQVESFEFTDGAWGMQEILDRLVRPGTSNADVITGDGLVDRMMGFAGNDTLRGRDGNDVLDGGEGNDALYGENDHDTLVGGLGNDYMEGGSGDDTYIIRLGDGSDTISEYYGNDRVVFEGIDSSQVMAVERYGDNLVIVFGEGQRLTINSYFQYAYRQVESFEFTDGAWGMQEILDRLVRPGTSNADVITGDGLVDRMMGFAGNDTLRGRDGNDVLDGGEGNDALYGENDHDTLVGGLGNDYMEGGSGDDTYIIRLGDGSDTISEYYGNDRVVFEGIDSSQVTAVERSGNDLVIRLGAEQSVTISAYFQYEYRQVEAFEFSDGSVWGDAEIAMLLNGLESAMASFGAASAEGGLAPWTSTPPPTVQIAAAI